MSGMQPGTGMTGRRSDLGEAMASLSRADRATAGMSRRKFLQLVGMGAGAGLSGNALLEALSPLTPGFDGAAQAAAPNDGILVIIGMYGGNDGANTVVHLDDGHYYDQRGSLAVSPGDALGIGSGRGLHPQLDTVKRFWDKDQLAIIEGVGYPDPDFSHFTSLAVWMSGHRHGSRPTGWVGRWLDESYGTTPDALGAATIGRGLPLHMVGRDQSAASIAYEGFNFGGSIESWNLRMYDAVRRVARPAGRGALHDQFAQTLVDQIDMGALVQPFMPAEDDSPEIVAKLNVAARLVNADIGLRVVDVGWHNFDQHANQPVNHGGLLAELDAGLKQFFSNLSPAVANRVTVMTFSEFGRTPFRNASNGTDHGSSSCAFVMGANVRGGLYGEHPSLAGLSRWDRPAHTVDFRSYYASVLDGWLGGGSASVLDSTYENLGLFERPPGVGTERPPYIGPAPPQPPKGRFVPIEPARILDTRDGTGSVIHRPVRENEAIWVPVAGRGDVPPKGATAVLANVTAVDATTPTYLTASPAGAPRPEASTVNPRVGIATANCTLMALGADGAVEVFNRFGSSQVIIDVFGYLSTDHGNRLAPLQPARLLDTRNGTGGITGPVDRRRRIDLRVAGRGGVPASGVTAVALNVTVTQPTSPGFVVTGASGAPLPGTSNVNFMPGDTVPNLVFCEVGDDGRVSLAAECDGAHLIVDVFGWIGPSAPGSIAAVAPHRILDTRIGLGAPKRRVGAIHTVRLQVAHRFPVFGAASAVLLNVTATNAGRDLFVTAWPSGRPMPETSNLNVPAGGTVANLVLCELNASGQIDFASPISHVDVIADVVGFVGA